MTTTKPPSTVGSICHITTIEGKRIFVRVEEEIRRPQSDSHGLKQIYLQKLRHNIGNRIEYRFTYYMWSVKGRMPDHWVFGQYSLMIPAKDLKWLLGKARELGWEGF